MNIRITTFTNPFSFFCTSKHINENGNFKTEYTDGFNINTSTRNNITTLNHGQYVAVIWSNKWARGVVSFESQLLIWLIDYGVFLRPNYKTIFIDLPSNIFEASIPPVDKVLGDLYLEIPDKGIVNLVNEQGTWSLFYEKNKEFYIDNLTEFYVTHRHHHACLKPDIPLKLPIITVQGNLDNYLAIIETLKKGSTFDEVSTMDNVFSKPEKDKHKYKITPEDMQKYANTYIKVNKWL